MKLFLVGVPVIVSCPFRPGFGWRCGAVNQKEVVQLQTAHPGSLVTGGTGEDHATQCSTFRTTDQRGSTAPGTLPSTQ